MNYTSKLTNTQMAAKVQTAISKMSKRQLAEVEKLAALANAEKNGATALLIAVIEAAHETQDPLAALRAARAEMQTHQASIEALAAAIRARQIILAKAEAQAAIIASKGGSHEAD